MLPIIGQTEAFDPATIVILDSALDKAWRTTQRQAKLNGNAEAARMVLAKHIIDMAATGERDHQRLIDGALARLRL